MRGRLVGMMLNRSNRGTIAQAIDALELQPGAVAADLGFGGGVGLALLLERVGPNGDRSRAPSPSTRFTSSLI